MKSSLQSISPQELLSLLDSEDYVGAVSATDKYEGQVFSEEQLGQLLDRSDLAWTSQTAATVSTAATPVVDLVGVAPPAGTAVPHSRAASAVMRCCRSSASECRDA